MSQTAETLRAMAQLLSDTIQGRGGLRAGDPQQPLVNIAACEAGARSVEVALEFIHYYTARGGCSNCGGLPHSTTCFVGRFAQILTSQLGDKTSGAHEC